MPTQQIKGSKRYRQAVDMTDMTKTYSVADASALLNTLPKAKFDETVEVYAHLTVEVYATLQSIHERAIKWYVVH